MTAGKIVVGAAIAMAAGAVLGVLFAPDKGAATRKKLSKQGSRYAGTLRDTASDYADTIEENLEAAGETVVGITDRVKNAVDSFGTAEPVKRRGRT